MSRGRTGVRIVSRTSAVVFALTALSFVSVSHAADPPVGWVTKGVVGLTLTQSAYSANWNGGDRGSWVWVARFDASAERAFGPRFHLANTLSLSYGQTSQQQEDPADPTRRVWDPPSKTNDRIAFESVGRFTLSAPVDPYASLRSESQFLDQSQPNGNLSLNPVRTTLSAGVARVFVKRDDREVIGRLGVGGRIAVGRDYTALPPSTSTASYRNGDAGLEWVTTASGPIVPDRLRFQGRLGVFQPLWYSDTDALERYDEVAAAAQPGHRAIASYWRTPDVDLEGTFTARITALLGVELSARLVYDRFDTSGRLDTAQDPAVLLPQVERRVRRAGQLRQNLAIALTQRLF